MISKNVSVYGKKAPRRCLRQKKAGRIFRSRAIGGRLQSRGREWQMRQGVKRIATPVTSVTGSQ